MNEFKELVECFTLIDVEENQQETYQRLLKKLVYFRDNYSLSKQVRKRNPEKYHFDYENNRDKILKRSRIQYIIKKYGCSIPKAEEIMVLKQMIKDYEKHKNDTELILKIHQGVIDVYDIVKNDKKFSPYLGQI